MKKQKEIHKEQDSLNIFDDLDGVLKASVPKEQPKDKETKKRS